MRRNSARKLGDCFQAAASLLCDLAEQDPATRAEVVHGVVTGSPDGPVAGLRFTHAWVETPGPLPEFPTVLDHSNGRQLELPAAIYYAVGQIDARTVERYDVHTLRRRMVRFKHYGPWDGVPAAHDDPQQAA